MTLQEQFQISGSVAFTGIAIVFIILVLLIGVISIFALITHMKSKSDKGEEVFPDADYATQDEDEETDTDGIVSSADVNNSSDETELIAVIMAAITTAMGAGNGFRLRSIRRSGRNTSSWNLSGRDEYLATRL